MHKLDHKLSKTKVIDQLPYLHALDIDLESNHIYLFGVDRGYDIAGGTESEPGVEFMMANRFIKNINMCMRVNPDKPIVIHMKTCGGIWEEGMAIYDAIKACPSLVTILNYTHARSMSSVILQAANKRVMMPNSHFMFHDGTLEVSGTVKGVESNVAFNKEASSTMLDIYAHALYNDGIYKHTDIVKIKKWLRTQMDKKEDVFLNAEAAVKYGFADEVFNNNWLKLTDYTQTQTQR